MSDLRVNNLKARTDGNVPTIVGGAVISGITSITGVLEAESGITAENVSATGIATISTAIVGTAVTINSSGVVATGVVTATSFSGNVTGNATGLTGTPDVAVTNITAGIVTATSFLGSGSNLTGLPAGFTELDAALFN
tara:strand:- start:603 stop:1016 length:414 start_codon:yes stop_codon:yes gene_type:complete